MMNDKRIGYDNKWPETTIGGAQYTRPVSVIALGYGYFAVLDVYGADIETVKELRGLVDKHVASNNRKAKGKEDVIHSEND